MMRERRGGLRASGLSAPLRLVFPLLEIGEVVDRSHSDTYDRVFLDGSTFFMVG